MSIDTAEKRKSISGIPFLAPGVTPNSAKDAEWRSEAGYSYARAGVTVVVFTAYHSFVDISLPNGVLALVTPGGYASIKLTNGVITMVAPFAPYLEVKLPEAVINLILPKISGTALTLTSNDVRVVEGLGRDAPPETRITEEGDIRVVDEYNYSAYPEVITVKLLDAVIEKNVP